MTQVDPASPAAEKGIKTGDVIVEIAQETVTSIDDVTKGIDKVKKAGGQAILLRLGAGKDDVPAWAAAALVVVALLGYLLHRGLLVWTNVALAYGHNDTSLHYYKHCHYLFPSGIFDENGTQRSVGRDPT